jgi:DNA-binding MarR family transcriptional regulator
VKPDDSAYQGLAGFRRAMRRFHAFSETRLKSAGITSQQYQAMLVIRVQPGRIVMIGDLARELLLRPNGAVQLTDRLVEAGLATRRQSSTDRRSVLVALTGKGARLLETLAAAHLQGMLEQEHLLAESLKRLRRLNR